MDLFKITGLLLFVIGFAVHYGLVRPALKKRWKETYYIGKLPFYLSGLYYFYDLNAYKKQCLEENRPLTLWYISILIMVLFLLWLFPGMVAYFFIR